MQNVEFIDLTQTTNFDVQNLSNQYF